MSLEQPRIIQVVEEKAVHKLSEFFINATEVQCVRTFAVWSNGVRVKFCAVGLLSYYSGSKYDGSMGAYRFLVERFGIYPFMSMKCPHCKSESSLLRLLPHLNDGVLNGEYSGKHPGMTFKEIGIWLQSLGL